MNIYFKGIQYKIHDSMFYISYKNVFPSKSNIGIFPTFLFELSPRAVCKKKIHINSKNLVRYCRNLALKLVQEH